jgi:hypothetical protein
VTYLFFRQDGFYEMDFENDVVAIANAIVNPGTLWVEDAAGNTIFTAEIPQAT